MKAMVRGFPSHRCHSCQPLWLAIFPSLGDRPMIQINRIIHR
jgi:hypothetical protein